MDPLVKKVAERALAGGYSSTTPKEWELGGEIIDKGMDHPAFKRIQDAWKDVETAMADVQRQSAGLKRIGVGRTEDPTLIGAKVIPALEDYAREVGLIAKQLKDRLGV